MIDALDQGRAIKEIKMLKPKNGDVIVFHLHRAPIQDDKTTVMNILKHVQAQVLIFLLGPGDSVDSVGTDEELKKYKLQRIPKVKPSILDPEGKRKQS